MRVTKRNKHSFNTFESLKNMGIKVSCGQKEPNILIEECPFTMLRTWISFSVDVFTSSSCWAVIFSAVISMIFTASSWPVCLCTHLRTTLLTPLRCHWCETKTQHGVFNHPKGKRRLPYWLLLLDPPANHLLGVILLVKLLSPHPVWQFISNDDVFGHDDSILIYNNNNNNNKLLLT